MEIASEFQYYLMMIIYFTLIPLGSFYAPWVIRSTIRYLDTNYPRDQYPGLISIDPKILVRVTWLDTALGILSLLALIASVTLWQSQMTDPYTVVIFICYYLFFRSIVWIVIGVKGTRYLSSLKRKAPLKRSATLQGTKLTDYIAPGIVAASLMLLVSAFGLNLWWYITDAGAHPAAIIVNLFIAVSLIVKLRQIFLGPKFRRIDPFVSHEDLFRQRRSMIRIQYIGTIIWVPVMLYIVSPQWEAFTHAASYSFLCIIFTMQYLWTAWLMKRWVKNTDISVYRVDDYPDASGAPAPGRS